MPRKTNHEKVMEQLEKIERYVGLIALCFAGQFVGTLALVIWRVAAGA